MKSLMSKISLAVVTVAAVAQANAATTAIDLTPVTSAFTAGDIVTGVLAIAATLAVVYASIKGVKIALGMLRGG